MSRRLRIRLYQPSNCAGAVSACHLFWPGLHQPGGNKKQDEYEDEDEVDEVEEERDDHEDEYERVKTMATIMSTMAIVFSAARPRSVPIRMIFTPPPISHDGLNGCISVRWLYQPQLV